MKENLDRIESKVDKLDERLDKHDVHLAEYNAQLKIHLARSEANEKAIDIIMAHVNKVNGALKLFSSIGIILTIIKVLEHFGGK